MRYLLLRDFPTHVERVKARADAGGHSASETTLFEAYKSSLSSLPNAILEMDDVWVYDNSPVGGPWGFIFLVRTSRASEPWMLDASVMAHGQSSGPTRLIGAVMPFEQLADLSTRKRPFRFSSRAYRGSHIPPAEGTADTSRRVSDEENSGC